MRLIAFIFFVAFSFGSAAADGPSLSTAPGDPELKRRVEKILLPQQRRDLRAGIIVYSLETKQVVMELNADEQLIPASVNKVLTAYAALKKLGPSSTFKTQIYADGIPKNGVLSGNLYLKGGGDPFLVSERMWMMVNDFKRTGIKIVRGDLIGDDSFFDREIRPDSRPVYLSDQAYNAPVSALSFNFNSTAVIVQPDDKAGQPLKYFSDPPDTSYIDVVNQAKTGSADSKPNLQVKRIDPVKKGETENIPASLSAGARNVGDTVLLRGSLPAGGKEQYFYRNIANPSLYTLHMFHMYLTRAGIAVEGNVKLGKLEESARLLTTFESTPLWQIVWGMNKFSNNFTADQIMKKLGAEIWGVPGTLDKGITALEDCLEDLGISRKSYKIADGSGLTRKSHISARQILKVMTAGYQDFSMSPEFVASLGIGGVDGTMRRRLTNTESPVRAKTGTLDGVSSLAGYTPSKDGEMLAFVILLNDNRMKYGDMRGWVDKVAREITKFSRSKRRG